MTTPKQITYKLVRYARKHPETQLTVFEIPQIPGYRRASHSNKGIDESFVTTVYAVPIALVESLSCRRAVCGLPGARAVSPDPQTSRGAGTRQFIRIDSARPQPNENSASAGAPGPTAPLPNGTAADCRRPTGANSGLKEIEAAHE